MPSTTALLSCFLRLPSYLTELSPLCRWQFSEPPRCWELSVAGAYHLSIRRQARLVPLWHRHSCLCAYCMCAIARREQSPDAPCATSLQTDPPPHTTSVDIPPSLVTNVRLPKCLPSHQSAHEHSRRHRRQAHSHQR